MGQTVEEGCISELRQLIKSHADLAVLGFGRSNLTVPYRRLQFLHGYSRLKHVTDLQSFSQTSMEGLFDCTAPIATFLEIIRPQSVRVHSELESSRKDSQGAWLVAT